MRKGEQVENGRQRIQLLPHTGARAEEEGMLRRPQLQRSDHGVAMHTVHASGRRAGRRAIREKEEEHERMGSNLTFRVIIRLFRWAR